MNRLDWLQHLSEPLAERTMVWLQPHRRPSDKIMNILTQTYQGGEPWLEALVAFVLETDGARTVQNADAVRIARQVWLDSWIRQGSPPLHELRAEGQWTDRRSRSIAIVRIGMVLDQALAGGRAPAEISTFIRTLLPSRYLRHLGWLNLESLPAPLVEFLQAQAGVTNPLVVDGRHKRIIGWLVHHRDKAWATHLACLAATLLGDLRGDGRQRCSPITVVNQLSAVKAILQTVHAHVGLDGIGSVDPATLLDAYIQGKLPGAEGRNWSSRAVAVNFYLSSVAAQERMLARQGDGIGELKKYILPVPRRVPLYLPDPHQVLADQTARRQQRMAELHRQYDRVIFLAVARTLAIQQVHQEFVKARRRTEVTGQEQAFDVTLSDGSATLSFRTVLDNRIRIAPDESGNSTGSLTEYLGAYRPDGGLLPDTFFVSLFKAWYDPQYQNILCEKGYKKKSFEVSARGLYKPSGRMSYFCGWQMRGSKKFKAQRAIFLDLNAIAMGITYGALGLLIMLTSGMRIHELQQVRVDANGKLRGTNESPLRLDDSGRISVSVFPKGGKKPGFEPVRHVLPLYITSVWQRARQLRMAVWGMERLVSLENGAEFDLPAAHYLFQSRSAGLSKVDINRMMFTATFGLSSLDQPDKPIILTAHDLRRLYAAWRQRAGHEFSHIQHALGHANASMTARYTSHQADEIMQPQSCIGPGSETLWEALSIIPTVHS